MPLEAAEATQEAKPWPGYFLVRTSGEVVPLIAIDELPPGTDLVGIPRSLDLEATVGMLNLGLQRSSGAFYQITHGQEDEAATYVARSNIPPPKSTTTPSTPLRQGSKQQANTSLSLAKSIHNPSNSTSSSAARPETQICRHWCAHGTCKWGQQCRYRHIMPMTLPGLQEAGLSDWPTWYRAMNPGYFVSESMGIKRRRDRLRREMLRQISKMGEDARSAAGLASLTVARVVPSERLRTPNRRLTRDRNVKREDLEEQIIARLRGMSVKLKEEQAEKMVKAREVAGLNTPTALIERAAAMDAKDWEEESGLVGDDRDSDVSVEKAKGKLVDV